MAPGRQNGRDARDAHFTKVAIERVEPGRSVELPILCLLRALRAFAVNVCRRMRAIAYR
jgi:hypothetical protein